MSWFWFLYIKTSLLKNNCLKHLSYTNHLILFVYIDIQCMYRYKSIGFVKNSSLTVDNKIILKMADGFFNNHIVSSVIEFVCSYEKNVSIYDSNINL